MKLSASTLGCPDWTLAQILTRFKAYGYDGVELRGLGPDLDLTQSPVFATPAALQQSRQAFADAGLEICCVDASARFTDAEAGERAKHADEARRAIDLASALGAPLVRVFGGAIPDGGSRAASLGFLVENLRALGDYAESAGGNVSVVLETHDAFSTGAQVAEVLAQVDHAGVGALWDLHHPFRAGETPAETFAALCPYVKLTHVKDSRPGGTYCLLGEGDVPLREMLALLHKGGYDGYVSVEWEKRWIPELADPQDALPQYAATLRRYLSELPE